MKRLTLFFIKACFVFLTAASLRGEVEIRALCPVTHAVKDRLQELGAVEKGDYAFRDYIYASKDKDLDLNKDFIRIRDYQKTQWNQKNVVVVHKTRDPIGRTSKINYKLEVDLLDQAKKAIGNRYDEKFSFRRNGWEYALNQHRFFVEEIEGLPPSVEVLGPSKESVMEMLNLIGLDIIVDQSVPEWVKNKNKIQNLPPITPYPVLGFRTIPFQNSSQTKRDILMWYPVGPLQPGELSQNPWDLFHVALNADPASSREKMPVIILSHGYTGHPNQLSWLIKGLVHEGFIVLAVRHMDLIDGKPHINHWRRAQDVTEMLDQFSTHPFSQAADLSKVGIAGFSLGGTTAIWIAGGTASKLDSLIPGPDYAFGDDFTLADQALPTLNKEMMAKEWRDHRVKAAFVMAPAWAWLFDEKSLQAISIPTYLIAASADQVLVTPNNAGFFARSIPSSRYQTISGKAGHYIFISALTDKQRGQADPSKQLSFLFEDDASVDRRWIQSQVIEQAVKFFNRSFDHAGKADRNEKSGLSVKI